MLVQQIQKVPESLFLALQNEIGGIDWDLEPESPIFENSKSINLRFHKPPDGFVMPTDNSEWRDIMESWRRIIPCVNVRAQMGKYPITLDASDWIYQQVSGLMLGRISIVNLYPGAIVPLHDDPLDYFETYSRFHIPVNTTPGVIFSSGPGTPEEHMHEGMLCRLNNRLPHMVINNSKFHRIHIIVDIQTEGNNQIF